jgi:hypothetical protein
MTRHRRQLAVVAVSVVAVAAIGAAVIAVRGGDHEQVRTGGSTTTTTTTTTVAPPPLARLRSLGTLAASGSFVLEADDALPAAFFLYDTTEAEPRGQRLDAPAELFPVDMAATDDGFLVVGTDCREAELGDEEPQCTPGTTVAFLYSLSTGRWTTLAEGLGERGDAAEALVTPEGRLFVWLERVDQSALYELHADDPPSAVPAPPFGSSGGLSPDAVMCPIDGGLLFLENPGEQVEGTSVAASTYDPSARRWTTPSLAPSVPNDGLIYLTNSCGDHGAVAMAPARTIGWFDGAWKVTESTPFEGREERTRRVVSEGHPAVWTDGWLWTYDEAAGTWNRSREIPSVPGLRAAVQVGDGWAVLRDPDRAGATPSFELIGR